MHKVIQFNPKTWPIDINTTLRRGAKNNFEKDFFNLMNNAVFGKTIENVRKHRDIKLITTNKRRNYLLSNLNNHRKKWFSKNLLAIEMKKIKLRVSKLVYLGLQILEISKTLMHEFWFHYIKPNYQQNTKLCYMDTDSLIPHIKTEDVYKDIANDVEKWFDTFDTLDTKYAIKRPLSREENKKVIGLMKDQLGGKNMTEFVALSPKTYSY